MAAKSNYGNESISALKGADRVRRRPGVIFGSDGLEGCEQAVFEILSNAIDEAREGYGKRITVTRYRDWSVQVEDQGRGIPVDYNPNEKRYNWELLFCEMYAGGKYNTDSADSYEYALGLNGLGLCSTQYASAYMDVFICRDGFEYELHFKKGEPAGEMKKTPTKRRDTGSVIRWLPDLEVFTDIAIPIDYYRDTLKRQAVVNPGVQLLLRSEREDGGVIRLAAWEEGDEIRVAVCDNGKGMTPEKIEELLHVDPEEQEQALRIRKSHVSGIGVDNVLHRLRLFYGRTDVMEITCEEGETCFLLKLPKQVMP